MGAPTSHRVSVWRAPAADDCIEDLTVVYCDEPGCPQRGHEVEEGVCYPKGARPRVARASAVP